MIECRELGCVEFAEAEALQADLAKRRAADLIPDTILLLEHPPIYTYGKQEIADDLLSNDEWRSQKGIALCAADRGGRLTYHGPGQLVGYLILKLIGWRRRVPLLVAEIESAIIDTLFQFGIRARHDPDHPGVWVDPSRGVPAKIAAIGLHLSRGVTRHGFSLNVNPDLSHYEGIIPCGIATRAVTSIAHELGESPDPARVRDALKTALLAKLAVDARG